jgi:hypothetical protein
MDGLLFIVPGFNIGDLSDLPSLEIENPVHDEIYNSGIIDYISESGTSVGLHNVPDVYSSKKVDWITWCSCNDVPKIRTDTLVNITSHASSILSSSMRRMENYRDDIIDHVSKNPHTQLCISSTHIVYDLAISCWAYPAMVSRMKSFAMDIFDDIISKINPIVNAMISYSGVTGFSSGDRNIRRHNGKIFKLDQDDEGPIIVSGKHHNKGCFVTDLGICYDGPVITHSDIEDIILASLGIGPSVFGVNDMTSYDAVISNHLESFGYV